MLFLQKIRYPYCQQEYSFFQWLHIGLKFKKSTIASSKILVNKYVKNQLFKDIFSGDLKKIYVYSTEILNLNQNGSFFLFYKSTVQQVVFYVGMLEKVIQPRMQTKKSQNTKSLKSTGTSDFFWTNERTKILQKLEHQEQLFKRQVGWY